MMAHLSVSEAVVSTVVTPVLSSVVATEVILVYYEVFLIVLLTIFPEVLQSVLIFLMTMAHLAERVIVVILGVSSKVATGLVLVECQVLQVIL